MSDIADRRAQGSPEQAVSPGEGQSNHDPGSLPNLEALPELRIYSRSNLFFLWPIWAVGFILAAITYIDGQRIALSNGKEILIHPNTGLGVIFIVVLALIVLFANVRMRGIYSVVGLLSVAFLTVLFAWLGWWDSIFSLIPQLSVFMNLGFYLTFSTLLLAIWAARFFFFDHFVYWRVRPGQLTEQHLVGGGEQSFDTRGMLFEQRGNDFFRHIVGFGASDLLLITTGARKQTIEIPNVLFADKKIKTMQRLIAIKPDEMLARTTAHTT